MIRKLSPRPVPASVTDVVVTPEQGVGRYDDKPMHLRMDLLLGHVESTPQFTLQQADEGTPWEDVETIAAVANPGVTATFTPGSQTIAATAHGLYEGQLVSLHTTGQLPTALREGHLYYVSKVISANAVQILPHNIVTFQPNSITDAGSGTHSLVPVQVLSSRLIPQVVADQPYLPTKRRYRWRATTAGGQTAQVIGLVIR